MALFTAMHYLLWKFILNKRERCLRKNRNRKIHLLPSAHARSTEPFLPRRIILPPKSKKKNKNTSGKICNALITTVELNYSLEQGVEC